jgi:hypothetical protein
MLVLVNTDHNIENHAGLTARIMSVVEDALRHRSNQMPG